MGHLNGLLLNLSFNCFELFFLALFLIFPLFPEVSSLFTLSICQRHVLKAFSEPFWGIALLHSVCLMLPCSNLLKLSKSCRFGSCFQGNFFIKSPKFIGVIWWLMEFFGIFEAERQCFFLLSKYFRVLLRIFLGKFIVFGKEFKFICLGCWTFDKNRPKVRSIKQFKWNYRIWYLRVFWWLE